MKDRAYLSLWTKQDPDILCDFCRKEPAMGDVCAPDGTPVLVVGPRLCLVNRKSPIWPKKFPRVVGNLSFQIWKRVAWL